MSGRPLPPNGRRYLASSRRSGPWVAIGPDAWRLARRKPFPVLVLPPGEEPRHYRWPVRGEPVLLVELGAFDTVYLERVARVLLEAGAAWVTAIRETLLPEQSADRQGRSWPLYRRRGSHVPG